MASVFVGEIKLVPYNFAPSGYVFCDGRLLPIAQFDTLFALIGTTYGGDGVNTFAVPDLRGRSAIHQGTGAGSTYVIGQAAGVENVTLNLGQLPSHVHDPVIAAVGGNSTTAASGARPASGGPAMYASALGTGAQLPLSNTGGTTPHDNMAPFLTLNWVISLFGIFPSQN